MRNRYTYCPSAHEALLECKPAADVAGLAVSLADLVERECAGIISGVDKLGIINYAKMARSVWMGMSISADSILVNLRLISSWV